jgi:restriction system protein
MGNMQDHVPKFHQLMWPTLQVLKNLGGSATNAEIIEELIEREKISDEGQKQLHKDGPMTQLEYRLGWARSYLKKFGAVTNSERGVWTITEKGQRLTSKDMDTIVQTVRKMITTSSRAKQDRTEVLFEQEENLEEWKRELLEVLQKRLSPASFERLAQRILRESGFFEVHVKGRSGDGGIDGHGRLRVGLLSFKALFQCKRYKGSVGPGEVRDFRGAMQGRTDKGIFLTTGNFTWSAKQEAQRDGAPTIELIDGDALCELLRRLKLGVTVKEVVSVDPDWFGSL